MTELEKYQEQNKAQTLQIIQLMQEIEDLKAKLEAVNYGNLYNLCRANHCLKECLEILRENNWRGDLQEQVNQCNAVETELLKLRTVLEQAKLARARIVEARSEPGAMSPDGGGG